MHRRPWHLRWCVVSLGVILVGALAWCRTSGSQTPASRLTVEARAVHLDPRTPTRTRLGRLTFLNGFVLHASDKRFGGWSGLALHPDGTELYAVSDHGYWLSTQLRQDASGRLEGFRAWQMGALLTPAGRGLNRVQRDAEEVVRDANGDFLVAFEGQHRLWRYPAARPPFSAPPRPLPVPPDLARAPFNGGIEAMTRLADGRLLVLTERFENPDGSRKGWLIANTDFMPVSYLASDGFEPTALATGPQGDVFLLERRYTIIDGLAVRLRLLPRARIQPQARLEGQLLAEIQAPMSLDNFEGLAVYASAATGTLLYLISDDNYSATQRTLVLQFRLSPDPAP